MIQIEICTFYDDSACGEIHDSQGTKSKETSIRDAKRATAIVTIIFSKSGFFIALTKGCLAPDTIITYLGAIINFKEGSFRIHPEKQSRFLILSRWIIKQIDEEKEFNVDILESYTGKCNYFCFCIQGGHAILRSLYIKIALTKTQTGKDSGQLTIVWGEEAATDILEWTKILLQYEVKSFWIEPTHKAFTFKQTSDANMNRWGAVLINTPLNGPDSDAHPVWRAGAEFDNQEHQMNIVVKEAIALKRGLQLSIKNIENITMDIKISHKELWDQIKHLEDKPVFDLGCDNMGVYLAAVKGSSRNPDVNKELKEMFAIARKNNVRLQFYWLDTKANHLADAITREEEENDFVLADDLFEEVNTRFGPFTVDAMASNNNNKCNTFFSRYDCPNSSFVNILAWTASEKDRRDENFYVYPPFAMIRVVLQHLLRQDINFTIIIPQNYENYGITAARRSFASMLLVETHSEKAATALRSYSNKPKPLLFNLHAYQFKTHPT